MAPVIASEAKQSSLSSRRLDCFVASLLAMTIRKTAPWMCSTTPMKVLEDTANKPRASARCFKDQGRWHSRQGEVRFFRPLHHCKARDGEA
jgi:hypothetical protein